VAHTAVVFKEVNLLSIPR